MWNPRQNNESNQLTFYFKHTVRARNRAHGFWIDQEKWNRLRTHLKHEQLQKHGIYISPLPPKKPIKGYAIVISLEKTHE